MAKTVAKIKISEVAKDFGMAGKDMLAYLKNIGIEKKSTSGSIEPAELNALFESIIKESVTEEDIAVLLVKGTSAEEKKEEPAVKEEKVSEKKAEKKGQSPIL